MNDDVPPRRAGAASVVLASLASACCVLALPWVSGGDPRALKKGLLVAVPLSLVTVFLGLASRQTLPGRVGLAAGCVVLLACGVVVAAVLVAS